MALTLRSTKGSPLTHAEMDANLSGLASGSNMTSPFTLTGDLVVNGSVTVGDASGDTLTINAGTWTYGANWAATRSAGALGASTQNVLSSTVTFSGDAGGTTQARPFVFVGTGSGSNAVSEFRGISASWTWNGSGVAVSSTYGITSTITVGSTGNATNLQAFRAGFTLSSSGNTTTADGFITVAPTLSSTGGITTLNGFRVGNIGHATLVGTAVAFKADDITASATAARGLQLSLASGTGKHNLYIDGTADNYLNGNVGIGTTTFGTSAAQVLAIETGTAPSTGPADTVQFYSSDDAAGHTVPSFFCEGTNVVATGQADSASSVRVKMRINGTVRTFLCI
jgi:hypothetical protein